MIAQCYWHRKTRSIADLVWIEDFKAMLISRINVPREHRGQGLGHRLLMEILKDADNHGVTLILEPVSSGPMTCLQLEEWYKKYGFEWSAPGVMKREPLTYGYLEETDEEIERTKNDV